MHLGISICLDYNLDYQLFTAIMDKYLGKSWSKLKLTIYTVKNRCCSLIDRYFFGCRILKYDSVLSYRRALTNYIIISCDKRDNHPKVCSLMSNGHASNMLAWGMCEITIFYLGYSERNKFCSGGSPENIKIPDNSLVLST